jgi:hypothetical protein
MLYWTEYLAGQRSKQEPLRPDPNYYLMIAKEREERQEARTLFDKLKQEYPILGRL